MASHEDRCHWEKQNTKYILSKSIYTPMALGSWLGPNRQLQWICAALTHGRGSCVCPMDVLKGMAMSQYLNMEAACACIIWFCQAILDFLIDPPVWRGCAKDPFPQGTPDLCCFSFHKSASPSHCWLWTCFTQRLQRGWSQRGCF